MLVLFEIVYYNYNSMFCLRVFGQKNRFFGNAYKAAAFDASYK